MEPPDARPAVVRDPAYSVVAGDEVCSPRDVYLLRPCASDRPAGAAPAGDCAVPVALGGAAPLPEVRVDLSWLSMPLEIERATRARLARGEVHVRGGIRGDTLLVREIVELPPPGGLFVSPSPAQRLAVDASSVYVATDKELLRVPKGGGAAVVLAGVRGANELVVDRGEVFVFDGSTVSRTTPDGGEPVVIASGQGGDGLTADETHLYWERDRESVRAPRGGGPVTRLADGGVASDLAVDATHVYWTDYFHQQVMKAPKAGGPPSRVAALWNPKRIALDGDRLVATSWLAGHGAVISASTRDGGGASFLAWRQETPELVTVSGGHAYWLARSGAGQSFEILKVPVAGGAIASLGPAGYGVSDVVSDAAHVYFATRCLERTVVFAVAR